MAKTRHIMPYPAWGPCLLMLHVPPEDSGEKFPFHVVALWDGPAYNPWDVLCWTNGQVDVGWPEYPDPSPYQLLLAQQICADPSLISDMCPNCNKRYGVPRTIRWNIHRGGVYPYGAPACPWDGTWPPTLWTPDQWPPAAAY